MGCGNFFFTVLITFSVALITYNILISANAPLKQDLPGPLSTTSSSSSSLSVDPIIKMPLGGSRRYGGGSNTKRRLFHTAVTASDSVYNTWQCRVMYYWFKKFQNGPNSEMGGFTRILHSGKPDKYVDEIPTFVAQPLPSGMDQGYIVLNRPWAFVQWLQQADIKEDYILMAEPDHIIVKPIPNLSKDGLGAAFPFFYIEPKKYESVLRKYFPEEKGPVTNIDPIGNSPVIIVKPPWDTEVGKKFIIHYTYGCDYNMKGELTYGKFGEWRFDKRSYDTVAPPRNLPLPPPGVPESVVTLVKMVNEATANIPNWES
ncbi:Hydroxyproline O-arabinosyltransferase 1 [Turnera subulata]|uniref:Hydroxyproline O-arabinosyltransferase 1 n=1 Tax=Turnera subulata TaxID=218843 RepID=A0A9Q0J416_9ROSI|nr:Hydroxyproline O-arabinosyltransferase 1 [Turnera subulata]